jgi:hypothetical protein
MYATQTGITTEAKNMYKLYKYYMTLYEPLISNVWYITIEDALIEVVFLLLPKLVGNN